MSIDDLVKVYDEANESNRFRSSQITGHKAALKAVADAVRAESPHDTHSSLIEVAFSQICQLSGRLSTLEARPAIPETPWNPGDNFVQQVMRRINALEARTR